MQVLKWSLSWSRKSSGWADFTSKGRLFQVFIIWYFGLVLSCPWLKLNMENLDDRKFSSSRLARAAKESNSAGSRPFLRLWINFALTDVPGTSQPHPLENAFEKHRVVKTEAQNIARLVIKCLFKRLRKAKFQKSCQSEIKFCCVVRYIFAIFCLWASEHVRDF